jgi:hypothetical protein
VRQAFYFGSEVTSSDVYDWVYPRRRHFLSQAHRHSVRRVLMMMADPVERAPTIGRPWLWRLRNGGEARVSTRDQDLAAQDAELMAASCAKVFKEKVSGAKTDRPELAKVIGRLEPGDVLVVAARSAGQIDARPTQRDRGDLGTGRWLSLAQRHVGRHDDAARPPDAHGARRVGRI